jgi:polar amino acid transport system substrate-binding protein
MESLGLPESSIYAQAPEGVTVVPLTTDAECIQSIQAGREEFSVVLTSNTVVEAAIAEGMDIVKVGDPVFSEDLAVAVDKAHTKDAASLVEELGRIIEEMHEDGTLSELSNKWFGGDLTQDPNE